MLLVTCDLCFVCETDLFGKLGTGLRKKIGSGLLVDIAPPCGHSLFSTLFSSY